MMPAGWAFPLRISSHSSMRVAFHLHAKSAQRSLADARGRHGDIGNDGAQLSFYYFMIEGLNGMGIGVKNLLHLEVCGRMDGMEQGPFLV